MLEFFLSLFSDKIYEAFCQFVEKILTFLVFNPLKYLLSQFLLNGPTSLGGFAGLPFNDICRGLTNVPSTFWSEVANTNTCQILIDNHINSLVIAYLSAWLIFFVTYCFVCTPQWLVIMLSHMSKILIEKLIPSSAPPKSTTQKTAEQKQQTVERARKTRLNNKRNEYISKVFLSCISEVHSQHDFVKIYLRPYIRLVQKELGFSFNVDSPIDEDDSEMFRLMNKGSIALVMIHK
jgi:hypothetical protein